MQFGSDLPLTSSGTPTLLGEEETVLMQQTNVSLYDGDEKKVRP